MLRESACSAVRWWCHMLLLEESQTALSDDGCTHTVTIEQIEQTPQGSRKILQSASYNFKEGAENESVRGSEEEAARCEARCEAARLRLVRPGVRRKRRRRSCSGGRKQQHAPAAPARIRATAVAAMQANSPVGVA